MYCIFYMFFYMYRFIQQEYGPIQDAKMCIQYLACDTESHCAVVHPVILSLQKFVHVAGALYLAMLVKSLIYTLFCDTLLIVDRTQWINLYERFE